MNVEETRETLMLKESVKKENLVCRAIMGEKTCSREKDSKKKTLYQAVEAAENEVSLTGLKGKA